jgi:selenocysteine-specific elongation factor
VLYRLVQSGVLTEDGPLVRLPGHTTVLSAQQRQQADRFLAALAASPFNPPGDAAIGQDVLAYLLDEGKVVRAAPDVVFTVEAYRQMTERVVQRIRQQGKVTLAEVRDMLGTSRKYVQALLEHMDQQRITRRVGDERVLR